MSRKNMVDNPGVYRIVNTVTGRQYIGATNRTMSGRWKAHCDALACHRHSNQALQADYDLYGLKAFQFEVIEVVQGGHDKVFAREIYWQDLNFEQSKRYNPPNSTHIPSDPSPIITTLSREEVLALQMMAVRITMRPVPTPEEMMYIGLSSGGALDRVSWIYYNVFEPGLIEYQAGRN